MFQHWPSIESFHRVRTDVLSYEEVVGIRLAPITYRGKVKIHGTNSGIIIKPNGKVIPQSRTRIISTGVDNAGFAAFVEQTKEYWATLAQDDVIVVYGEWCGKGIMKGVAVSEVPEKVLAVFAIQYGLSNNDMTPVYVEPSTIESMLGQTPSNVYVLPWYDEDITTDFFDVDNLKASVEKMNAAVDQVEECDPWIKAVFDISGLGEGIVYYPVSMNAPNNSLSRSDIGRYMFKAKGAKHQVVKTKKSVEVDPEVAATIEAFVNMVATEGRMEQALIEGAKGKLDKRLVGPVIGWFSRDIKKDLDNGEIFLPENIEWKLVTKPLTSRIQRWYFKKLAEI